MVHAGWDSEEEARAVGEEIEQLQRKEHTQQMAILVRASFQMRVFEDRFVTLGLNYRVIGGPILRAPGNPRRAGLFPRRRPARRRPRLRAHRQCAETRARRSRRPPNPRRTRANSVPLLAGQRKTDPDRRAEAEARTTLRNMVDLFTRWAAASNQAAHRARRENPRGSGYTEMWKTDRSADAPGRLENLRN